MEGGVVVGKPLPEQGQRGEELAAPDIAPDSHCFTPYPCPYHEHCTRDRIDPEHGIDELSRLVASRWARLEAAGVEEIRNIPEDFPLTRLQRIVRRAVREDRAVVHGDIVRALAGGAPPVHHLDFETFAPTIPRFAGTSPYDQIPFLFSVHTERGDDPRPALADRLIAAVGREGTICTYSDYEHKVLRDLAAALPDRAPALRAIQRRLFDLHPVVLNGYYPDFANSADLEMITR